LDFLSLTGKVRRNQANEGDRLEYLTALVLLKLGVKKVIRSIEIKEKEQKSPHAEIDILFNYGGRLWIGDCKDRNSRDWMFKAITQQFGSESDIGNRIVGELKISGLKEMKDDLMSANITGGLQAQIICIRKTPFTEPEQQYANANRIAVATKKTLYDDMRRILNPRRSATTADLETLKAIFNS